MKNLLELLTTESISSNELTTVIINYLDKDVQLLGAKRVSDNIVSIIYLKTEDNKLINIIGELSLGGKRITIKAIN